MTEIRIPANTLKTGDTLSLQTEESFEVWEALPITCREAARLLAAIDKPPLPAPENVDEDLYLGVMSTIETDRVCLGMWPADPPCTDYDNRADCDAEGEPICSVCGCGGETLTPVSDADHRLVCEDCNPTELVLHWHVCTEKIGHEGTHICFCGAEWP